MAFHNTRLGFLPAAAVAPAIGIPGVNVVLGVVTAAVSLYSLFKTWFQRGELKVKATNKAEDFVRAFYTLQSGQWPIPGGLPIVAGGNTFSRESVAGMIEACYTTAASSFLDTLERQLVELAKTDTYFAAWANQYGYNDIRNLRRTISEAGCTEDRSADILPPSEQQQQPPATCPPGTTYSAAFGGCTGGNGSGGSTESPAPTQSSMMPYALLAGFGIFALVLSRR